MMANVKMIGASPLGGTIYSGTLNPDKGLWVGNKTDVTDQVIKAVFDHMMVVKKDYAFKTHDGKFAVLRFTVHDELPDDFANKYGEQGGDHA